MTTGDANRGSGDAPAPEGSPTPAVVPPGTPAVPSPDFPAPVPQPAGSWDLDLASASLRIDTSDTETLFEALGNKLVRILGGRAQLQREGGLRRSRRIIRIVVDTGEGRLEAARGRTGPVFLATHAVRGVTLQTTEISADEWLDRLVSLVRAEAARSNDVRYALGRMLES